MNLKVLLAALVLSSPLYGQTQEIKTTPITPSTQVDSTKGAASEFKVTALYPPLAGAITGGIFGLITSLVVQLWLPRMKRKGLTKALKIEVAEHHGTDVRMRVYNGGLWTINKATLYLTLEVQKPEVLAPAPYGAHITDTDFVPIKDDQLCWSVRSPTLYPMQVPIFAKERQPFTLCKISGPSITIPSEEGWPPEKYARAFLQKKRYSGVLKIVSDDTDARLFSVTIDPETKPMCQIVPL